MIKHKVALRVNLKPVFVKEDLTYAALREVEKQISRELWQAFGGWQQINQSTVGERGTVNLSISWECTMNGRAPRRPKDVIAKEKAEQGVRSQARREQREKYRREADQRVIDIRQRIKNQVAIAASHGLMPDSIARTVEEAAAPRKDWKEELARFVYNTCKSDSRTWTRQSRRVVGLPGWNREIESNVVIVLDTSGSVTGPILSAFLAECRAITALNGITAVVMSADAAVQQVIQPGEPFPEKWRGGGGTNFVPALRAAEEYQPNCIIYLTDGDGAYPKGSMYPVLWALTKPRKVPFGETILLEGINV